MLKWAVARDDLRQSARHLDADPSKKKRATGPGNPHHHHQCLHIPEHSVDKGSANGVYPSKEVKVVESVKVESRFRNVPNGASHPSPTVAKVAVTSTASRKESGLVKSEPVKNAFNASKEFDNEKATLRTKYNVPLRSPAQSSSTDSNRNSTAGSKSLLYMSLDHLPLAIVKQYQRMLQETSEEEQKRETEKRAKTVEDIKSERKKKKKQRSATVVVDPKQLLTIAANHERHEPLKGIMKTSYGTNGGSGQQKNVISADFASNRCSNWNDQKQSISEPNNGKSIEPVVHGHQLQIKTVKEAKSRLLSVNDSFRQGKEEKRKFKRKTPSPVLRLAPDWDVQCVVDGGNYATTSCKSSTLPRPRKNCLESVIEPKFSKKNDITTSPEKSHRSNRPQHRRSRSTCDLEGHLSLLECDRSSPFDSQMFESSLAIYTPAVSRCAKRVTLKRSELRKLEKIRNQTEKLNRFLKKYYHDYLPNLPENEEVVCSPELKSVHFSDMQESWIDCQPNYSSLDRASVRRRIPTATSTPPSNRHLLTSSAYYSDPMLSGLPATIMSPERRSAQRVPSGRLTKQKSCINLASRFDEISLVEHISNEEDDCKNVHDNDESFLMNSKDFSSNHDDPSLLALQKREILNRRHEENVNEAEICSAVAMARSLCSTGEEVELPVKSRFSAGTGSYNDGNHEVKDATPFEEKLKGNKIAMKINGLEPLAALQYKKNPFVVPPSKTVMVDDHHEDEGFMSPCPPEVYSSSGSTTSQEGGHRLSLSSSGKGSAEDLDDDDSYRLKLSCYANHNNYDIPEHVEQPNEDDGEYALLTSKSSSSAYSDGGVVCGSFIPNLNHFQVGNKYEYQSCSDSSSGYYASVTSVVYEECERPNYYDIPEENHQEHIYDDVAKELQCRYEDTF